uniref:Uncharacterized protein n=1 Tax=Ascaris lumbricoides TaxID=6252 RepID=A0A0M3HTZ5_ASCLU
MQRDYSQPHLRHLSHLRRRCFNLRIAQRIHHLKRPVQFFYNTLGVRLTSSSF